MKEKNTICVHPYSSPCGELLLGSLGGELCLCDWLATSHPDRVLHRLTRLLHATVQRCATPVTDDARRQLDDYFALRRKTFSMPLLFAGTPFQMAVWQELLRIPYGHTVSYGDMARRLGMPAAVRAVASANAANAISIFAPCHRVIGSDGSLTGYAGGILAKRHLLHLEHAASRT